MKDSHYSVVDISDVSRIFIYKRGVEDIANIVEFYSKKIRVAWIIKRKKETSYTVSYPSPTRYDKDNIQFVTGLSKSQFIGAVLNNEHLSDFREWCLFNLAGSNE